jgi:hypothetical protein
MHDLAKNTNPQLKRNKHYSSTFVLRRGFEIYQCTNNIDINYRLFHKPDAEAKRLAFEKALEDLKQLGGKL